jgi:general stress protein YciG
MAGKSPRGFGAMDLEKQRQIASKGGKAAHQKGTAHEFTPEEARAAGRKGGMAAHQKGTAHQFTPQEAAEAGRKGGRAAHQKAANRLAGGELQQGPNGNGSAMPANQPTATQSPVPQVSGLAAGNQNFELGLEPMPMGQSKEQPPILNTP